jgi:hypothetical protein
MSEKPDIKRAIAFFDGQNLFYAAKKAFGYTSPNYEPIMLAASVCKARGWKLHRPPSAASSRACSPPKPPLLMMST